MIIFIYGTTAEAIKLAPVARRLEALNIPYEQWVTFQHTQALRTAMTQLGLGEPDRVIAEGWRGKPLKTPLQMLGWMFSVAGWTVRNAVGLRRGVGKDSIVVVHGDTMTTVLGSFIGRVLGLPVAHVEAGLRSGDWRHPFPEELDRRIVGRVAAVHYAPSLEAADNLAGRKNVVFTHGNTVKDAVRDSAGADAAIEGDRYGLVLLHRFEFISQPTLVRDTLRTLEESSTLPLRLIVDSYSRDAIEATIADIGASRFTIMGKLEHGEFVELLRGAAFVVTDSGGIQEESAVFGIPTLVHRKATERSEGIGTSARLSGWDLATVRDFLGSFDSYRNDDVQSDASPSGIIVDDLVARGYAVPGPVPA